MIRFHSKYDDAPLPRLYRFVMWEDDGAYYAPIGLASLCRLPLHAAFLAGRLVAALTMYWDWMRDWYTDGRFC